MKTIHTNAGAIARVSDCDFVYLRQFTWHQDRKGYFIGRTGEVRDKRMHRIIAARAGLDLSKQIDHRDRDKSNNQRRNLRAATHGQNRANSRTNRNNKSGFKGVHLLGARVRLSNHKVRSDKIGDRWVAQINVNGRKLFLGHFDTAHKAHRAYQKAARQHFGEFART